MSSSPLVLVIEGEPQTRRFLRPVLKNRGFRVVEASTGNTGLEEAASRRPEIVLLDLGLPDIDGVEVTRKLREWTFVPIIVLSVRDQEDEKIEEEMLLAAPVVSSGDLRIDLANRNVTLAGEEVHLTPTEYELLAVLLRSPGKVISHRVLLKEVWGNAYADHVEYLRVYMAQLRRKLEPNQARPRYILTEPGVGYRIRVE